MYNFFAFAFRILSDSTVHIRKGRAADAVEEWCQLEIDYYIFAVSAVSGFVCEGYAESGAVLLRDLKLRAVAEADIGWRGQHRIVQGSLYLWTVIESYKLAYLSGVKLFSGDIYRWYHFFRNARQGEVGDDMSIPVRKPRRTQAECNENDRKCYQDYVVGFLSETHGLLRFL